MEESNEIKLPEDLLLEIQSLKDKLTENVIKIGRLSVQKSFYERDLEMINMELNTLFNDAENISNLEQEMEIKITTQYGAGKLDLASGLFIKV
jgi:hypothetical protein